MFSDNKESLRDLDSEIYLSDDEWSVYRHKFECFTVKMWVACSLTVTCIAITYTTHSLCKVHTFYQKIGICITYMGVNDMQAMHMAVNSVALLINS